MNMDIDKHDKRIAFLEDIWYRTFNMVNSEYYNLMLVTMRKKGVEHVSLVFAAALLSNVYRLNYNVSKDTINLEEIKEISKDLINSKFDSWLEDKLRIDRN